MPVLATQSVEATTNDLNEEQTSVQLKDVKDGKLDFEKNGKCFSFCENRI
jgi:hypothetical protein